MDSENMGFEPSTFDFEVPGVSLESHWDGSDNGESLTGTSIHI